MAKVNLKITDIKVDLSGVKVSTLPHQQGKDVEKLMEKHGFPIQTGAGPDIIGTDVEIKSKRIKSKSANTIATISENKLISTPYEKSNACKKLQKQQRVYLSENGIIEKNILFDFSKPFIQDIFKQTWEHARSQFINGKISDSQVTVTGSKYGYFERIYRNKKPTGTWKFRINVAPMLRLESMSKSTLGNNSLFEYK